MFRTCSELALASWSHPRGGVNGGSPPLRLNAVPPFRSINEVGSPRVWGRVGLGLGRAEFAGVFFVDILKLFKDFPDFFRSAGVEPGFHRGWTGVYGGWAGFGLQLIRADPGQNRTCGHSFSLFFDVF